VRDVASGQARVLKTCAPTADDADPPPRWPTRNGWRGVVNDA
jgi:hypothetical protein